MTLLRIIIGCTLFALLSQYAQAGSRGLNLVFVSIGTHEIYDDKFYSYFVEGNLENGDEANNCWEQLVDGRKANRAIEFVARTNRPKGLDQTLAKKVWGYDIAATRIARSILRKKYTAEYFSLDDGFDGMYLFNSDGKTLKMMTLGAHGGESKKISIQLDDENPRRTAAEFSYAMCKIGDPLMIGFGV